MNLSDSALPGPNILLMGPAGTGKTRSIATLVETGIEVFYVALEQGMESLVDFWTSQGKPIPPNLHWHRITPPKKDYGSLKDIAVKINTLAFATLASWTDPGRHTHNTMINVLEAFHNFRDDRTKKEFGPVDEWGPDRAIVLDGLTGLSEAAMSATVGGKPLRDVKDYGLAQNQVETFVQMSCTNTRAWFILISHVDREVDQILGGTKLSPSTVGNKLSPKLPPMFSDVILCVREGAKWTWDTASSQADVKARYLPWKAGQPPDFRPIFDSWIKRAEAMTGEVSHGPAQ